MLTSLLGTINFVAVKKLTINFVAIRQTIQKKMPLLRLSVIPIHITHMVNPRAGMHKFSRMN